MSKEEAKKFIIETVVSYIEELGDIEAVVGTDPEHKIDLQKALEVLGYDWAAKVVESYKEKGF